MPVSCVMLQRKELINMSSNWKNHQLQFWNGPKLDMTLVITLSSCSFLLEKTFKPTPFPRTLSSWQQSKFGVKTIFHLKEGTLFNTINSYQYFQSLNFIAYWCTKWVYKTDVTKGYRVIPPHIEMSPWCRSSYDCITTLTSL